MPQEEKSIIRVINSTNIELESMEIQDQFEGTAEDGVESPEKSYKNYGNFTPFAKINDYYVKPNEIIRMNLSCTEFLPTISLQIKLHNNTTFLSTSFPKDGDLLSIYIKGKSDIFKPIRNDYVITAVSTSNIEEAKKDTFTGFGMTINISGELYIPNLHTQANIAINDTSFEALYQISEELDLGFATNEEFTNDKQKWLNIGHTHKNFIQHITEHAWKNSDSFYKSFIDLYYNLNFINVNNQFTNSTEIDDGILDAIIFNDDSTTTGGKSQALNKKFLTNYVDYSGTNNYIKSYKPINNSFNISKKLGYRMNTRFYEHETQEYWNLFTEPIYTDETENEYILLRGRPNDDLHEKIRNDKWLGIQYSDNTHDKYKFARLHNLINNMELEKLNLTIEIPRANFNIYRGERIPCLLFDDMNSPYKVPFSQTPEEIDDPDLKAGEGVVLDKFYSGFYMIKGMNFKYNLSAPSGDSGVMKEEVVLTRREWPVP